jgi:flagellar hook protein FlgE
MLRSLFTGISGLRAHQQMLDVTSNNIANVNTTGFKSSNTVFESTLSQTIEGAGAPIVNGGTNPVQVGLGVQLAGTEVNFNQGNNQYTGRTSDVMINGDGFFAVQKNGATSFTRAGSFSLDKSGHLVSPDGSTLEDSTGAVIDLSALNSGTYTSWSISPQGNVNAVDSTGATTSLATIGVATFANPAGLAASGNTQWAQTANSGAPTFGAPDTANRGSLTSGYLEMSNVDLSTELTNLIISERGFQANSRVITVSDEILQSLVNLGH